MPAMFDEEKPQAPAPPDASTPAAPAKEDAAHAVVLPVGLREIALTPEAAEEMRRRLDDANHPARAGKEMPTADASALGNRSR
ncbi:hypothetical protein AYO44_12610 [Planctomycetaceae bacterium SCGC AG-212-F19]|nr:hypothetical protein AYO44_12610 [Planctomycetaceae bacterium SCGC AG-212-F19]